MFLWNVSICPLHSAETQKQPSSDQQPPWKLYNTQYHEDVSGSGNVSTHS
jgi:hypothetical protein